MSGYPRRHRCGHCSGGNGAKAEHEPSDGRPRGGGERCPGGASSGRRSRGARGRTAGSRSAIRGVTRLACLLFACLLTGCAAADSDRLEAYGQAFDEARTLAEATLDDAEAAAAAQELDLTADLAARREALAAVGVYNDLLVAIACADDDAAAAAGDARRLAEVLASLAGTLAGTDAQEAVGRWADHADQVGGVVIRLDDLLARRRYREAVATAGPVVEELLRLLAADAPALGTIISGPLRERQLDALDELVAVSFEFERLTAGLRSTGDAAKPPAPDGGRGAVPDARALRERLNAARAAATLPAGLAPLQPLTAPAADSHAPTDAEMQQLRRLVERAEACSAELRRCGRTLAARGALTERHGAALHAAAEAMQQLRTGAMEPDAAAAIAALIEHVRWFRESYEAFQEGMR